MAIAIGSYGLLDSTAPRYLGLPMLLGGVALGWVGVVSSGRRIERSRYRPDPWRIEEWGVSLVGVTVAAVMVAVSTVDPTALHPSLQPLRWPDLPRRSRGRRAARPPPGVDRAARPPAGGRAGRGRRGAAGARRVIRFEHVTITYADAPGPVLRDVHLTVPEGELCVVVGPTGSGKTTLPRRDQRPGAALHRRPPGRAGRGRRPRHPRPPAP